MPRLLNINTRKKVGNPKKSIWYVCELVMEIKIDGEPKNVVHKNLFLINALDSEQAYEKALRLGHGAETSYLNPRGRTVEHCFRGISKLDILIDGSPEDGAELAFQEIVGLSEKALVSLLPPKEQLWAFKTPDTSRKRSPDYQSRDALLQARRLLTNRDEE